MGILGQLPFGIPGVPGSTRQQAARPLAAGFALKPVGTPFPQTLNQTSFVGIATGDQTVTAGQWGQIGYYLVKAQQMAAFGVGNLTDNPENQGKVFISLFNTTDSVALAGWIRLVQKDANQLSLDPVVEQRSEIWAMNSTDPTKWERLLEHQVWAREDSLLAIEVKSDGSGAKVIDKESAVIRIDSTIYQ